MDEHSNKNTRPVWGEIAGRSYELSRKLISVMRAFYNAKRKGRKRLAEMSLLRRVQCNLTAITYLADLCYKKDSLYFKIPVGLLMRSCLMDTIYALYLHVLSAKEAEEEIEVLNKSYVKSLDERFDVYKDKVAHVGFSEELTRDFYNLGREDIFMRYLTFEKKGEKLTTNVVRSKELRTIHKSWPENITIARMVEHIQTRPKTAAVVTRLNAYYKYFSQYEHFSEQGFGDSLAHFGDDNVSFPAAIDALEKGMGLVVKM